MLERDIVAAIMRYLKTVPECFAWKTHGGPYSQAGIPDIIACVGGRFVALEVKTPSGKPTMIQEATIRRINEAKGNAHIVRSLDDAKQIILNITGGLAL